MLSLTFPLLFTTIILTSLCDDTVTIKSASEFVTFSENVSIGTNYSGTTVFLDADIDFAGGYSEHFTPIGYSSPFLGTFDGQGHTISNLAMNSLTQDTGLFGYSTSTTIQNVVIDSTCSFVSSYASTGYPSVGSIIGYCYSSRGSCMIENNVNMAGVTFSGSAAGNVYIGGIVGSFHQSSYPNTIKNCANYGTVTHSGTGDRWVELGGIVGYGEGSSSSYNHIQNCLNYGTIINNGTSSTLAMGGVSGLSYYSYIDNCVNLGVISTNQESDYVGAIVGYTSYTKATHCYWADNIGYKSAAGYIYSSILSDNSEFNPATFKLSDSVAIGISSKTSLIDALNAATDHYTLREYSHWLFNMDNHDVSFTVNDAKLGITLSSQVILLPKPASRGTTAFHGWYTDSSCASPLTDYVTVDDLMLYGKFEENSNNYTIKFDTRGGSSVEPITEKFGSIVTLPTGSTREYCKLIRWENEYGDDVSDEFVIPAQNVTLYAVWLCTRITTISDFISFSNIVNSGTNYYGTTVFLDADIDFAGGYSEHFTPIGYSSPFLGTFDGQGHTISNLAMNSSVEDTGLFGYSEGTTIQNVVIDSTCSFVSSYASTGYPSVGSIIGYCYSSGEPCMVENNVNMASVTFSGSAAGNVFIGGIVGSFYQSSYPNYIKNCANYGTVTHSGTGDRWVELGGIGGYISRNSLSYNYVQNCLNYGTIINNGTSSTLAMGGVIANSYYSYIDNCVNLGVISTNQEGDYVGAIVGYTSYTKATHCYWADNIGYKSAAGYIYSSILSDNSEFNPATFKLSDSVAIRISSKTSLIDALNAAADHYTLREYSHWLLNMDNQNISFTVNDVELNIILTSQVILLPKLASRGTTGFNGWYTDSSCASPLTDYVTVDDLMLYGKFEENSNNYTIKFDTRGGSSVEPITGKFGSIVTLPTGSTREYCKLVRWENEYGDDVSNEFVIPAQNVTLYAVWLCTRITTVSDFISFSNIVNSGTNYYGTTVFLDADIDFAGGYSEHFTPIGYSSPFLGTFDGQGHTISNLAMNSSAQYTGLFGYSTSTTIQNVVIDSTCSFVSSYASTDYPSVGSIIGYCYSSREPCMVENNVNVAGVTFSGSAAGNVFIGGIVGYLYSNRYSSTIKNCANYGTVTHTGTGDRWVELGGIIGLSETYDEYHYIQNCLNYGTIISNGTSSTLAMGGIASVSYHSYINNCVSFGVISTNQEGDYVGAIVGYISSYTKATHCYWADNIGYKFAVGYINSPTLITDNSEFNSATFELSKSVTIGISSKTSLIDALNAAADHYTLREYSHWLFNKDNHAVSFTVNDVELNITLSSKIILLPKPAGRGTTAFYGWYTDSSCASPLTDYVTVDDLMLYGKFEENSNNYTIRFDTRGGSSVEPITGKFGSIVTLPTNPTKESYAFVRWKNEYGDDVSNEFVIPAQNVTLYAVWLCTRITTVSEFIAFSEAVDNGTTYSGVTVFLDADIDFAGGYSEHFTPIGYSSPFLGTFDGQGHTISNLAMNSSVEDAGLFGYSTSTTIQNVVIDSTCSFLSSYASTGYPSVGSIIGYCYSSRGSCMIENTVNMAGVTFSGSAAGNVFIGGIIGSFHQSSYPNTIKNCANYGTVTHSGTGDRWVELGGIVGYGEGSSSSYNHIQNCLNYGTIINNGTSSTLAMGGVSGLSYYSYIDNCVNLGVISTNQEGYYVGAIVGYTSCTKITHCYWADNIGYKSAAGYKDSTTSVVNSSSVSLSKATVDELNEYVAAKSSVWSRWLMLHLNGGHINDIAQKSLVGLQKALPIPVKAGCSFLFWCKDAECTEKFDPSKDNNTDTAIIYVRWAINNYTVTFDFGNGTTVNASFSYNASIVYPRNIIKEGYTFSGWDNRPDFMPAKDITITALWTETVISKSVEIVFDTKVLGTKNEEEIKEIIKSYTDEEFTITSIEHDLESGEIRVIVNFVNEAKAEDFVRTVNENKRSDSAIKRMGFVSDGSFSSSKALFSLITFLFFV